MSSFRVLLYAVLVLLLSTRFTCQKCIGNSSRAHAHVAFYLDGEEIDDVIFDDIRALNGQFEYQPENPLSLEFDPGRDSVVYIFESDIAQDTLAFRYRIERTTEGGAYCISYSEAELLGSTTFDVICISIDVPRDVNDSTLCSTHDIGIAL